MSSYKQLNKELRVLKKEYKAKYGLPCPICQQIRPRTNPTILLPQEQCKSDGYWDPRIKDEAHQKYLEKINEIKALN